MNTESTPVRLMYKMRSPEKLLTAPFLELENQELYFSRLDKLNDPYEGFLDIYWKGDTVLWRNFLRQYLLSLYEMVYFAPFFKKDHIFEHKDINVYITIDDLPTEQDKVVFQKAEKSFFKDERVVAFLNFLVNYKSKLHEIDIKGFLSLIHPIAFEYICREQSEKKQLAEYFSNVAKDMPIQYLFERLEKTPDEIDENTLSVVMEVTSSVHDQMLLLALYNSDDITNYRRTAFIASRFPMEFVSQLTTLVVPDAFVSSFMSKIDNPALWGYYAENHTGACLIFKCTDYEKRSSISLNVESTGAGNNFSWLGFNKIVYSRKALSVNFFKFINTLPLGKLYQTWYKGEKEFTKYFDEFGISKNVNKWRKELWELMDRRACRKFPEWKNENEYRLILNDFLRWDRNEIGIKAKYKFEDLDGIVFGYKMKVEDKLKIMEIIERKCKEFKRHEFNFYQAEYSFTSGKIEIHKLDLLQIN